MLNKLKNIIKLEKLQLNHLFNKLQTLVAGPQALPWLAVIFSLEGFLFLPLDLLLIFYGLKNRSKMWLAATNAALFSSLGSFIGYGLGAYAWKFVGHFVLRYLISEDNFLWLAQQFHEHQFAVLFFGALSPIMPFKALTISAGFCHIPVHFFFGTILLARSFRFAIVTILTLVFGEKIVKLVKNYAYHILLFVSLVSAIILLLIWTRKR